MQICLNIDPDAILKQLEPLELTEYVKSHDKKFDMLEAFSKEELIQYMVDTKIIDEEVVSFMVDAGKLELEKILGKVANIQFKKSFSKFLFYSIRVRTRLPCSIPPPFPAPRFCCC